MELYRKYRPGTFEDIVGNELAIKSMKKELENGSHVFLLTGGAGTGKTTIARIAAKEVKAGELSIREINSADNRGIDTAREIMEQMQYCSTDGNCLVWILDEVHMLTSQAQNSFLKALEDTPSHVYFFLCTTDPQKLIAPLKSRCSIIEMKPLKDDEMAFLIKRTARQEKTKLQQEVIERIAELAQGGSRKGLKLLAKVLYLEEGEQLKALVNDSEESKEVIELCRALLNGKVSLKMLKGIDLSEPEKVRMAVLGYMNAVLMNKGIDTKAVAAMQAFSQPTFNNGKFAITIAVLDFMDMMVGGD